LSVVVVVRLSEAVVVFVSVKFDPKVVVAVTVLPSDSVVVELDVPVSQLPVIAVVRLSDALVELVWLKTPLLPLPPPPVPPNGAPISNSCSPACIASVSDSVAVSLKDPVNQLPTVVVVKASVTVVVLLALAGLLTDSSVTVAEADAVVVAATEPLTRFSTVVVVRLSVAVVVLMSVAV
jgi:hypothetical protein